MEVIMKTLSAGPDGVVSPGEKVTVSKEQGDALVSGGFGQYETAAVKIPEKREESKPEKPEPVAKAPEKKSAKKK